MNDNDNHVDTTYQPFIPTDRQLLIIHMIAIGVLAVVETFLAWAVVSSVFANLANNAACYFAGFLIFGLVLALLVFRFKRLVWPADPAEDHETVEAWKERDAADGNLFRAGLRAGAGMGWRPVATLNLEVTPDPELDVPDSIFGIPA